MKPPEPKCSHKCSQESCNASLLRFPANLNQPFIIPVKILMQFSDVFLHERIWVSLIRRLPELELLKIYKRQSFLRHQQCIPIRQLIKSVNAAFLIPRIKCSIRCTSAACGAQTLKRKLRHQFFAPPKNSCVYNYGLHERHNRKTF